MKIIGDAIQDKRINSYNYMMELTLREYYDLSKGVLANNEYQRRRVKSSSTVYSLLKEDLKRGCLMPPIVMALAQDVKSVSEVEEVLKKNNSKLVILDGLQRSYTIKALMEELVKTGDDEIETVSQNKIRVELYVGINKLGILYRMLTLNTGQTPMSARHQIEIIYSDYIGMEIEGVRLIREIDDATPRQKGEYKFRDIIEGFTSYIQRDYLTMERTDILDNIKSLEKLSTIDSSNQMFEQFVRCYHSFVDELDKAVPDTILDSDEKEELSNVFGNDVVAIFKKSQPLTGFGAAIGRLEDFHVYQRIEELMSTIGNLKRETIFPGLKLLIVNLSKVRENAKKIGNDQRLFFYQFFQKLFDKDRDSFGDLEMSARDAYTAYQRETM